MKRPRVLLADDHMILLEGTKALLSPDFDIVGTAGDGRELLAAAAKLKPDVVVADISMPLLNGIEAARRLAESCPRCRTILLTMYKDAALLKEALRAGASGYVLKRSAVAELRTAIREALAGRFYVSPALAGLVEYPLPILLAPPSSAAREARRGPSADLTPRQREVLQAVAEGKSLKEIAAILGITIKTVEYHKYRTMKALGVRTTAELTRYAVKLHLVFPD
jgi:DNA-binding NarL/FixJ family response regulator